MVGRFGNTTRRPYIEGRLVLPRLGVRVEISFLVDTGADQCVLMPADAKRASLDYSVLNPAVEVGGVGGSCEMHPEQGVAVFVEEDGTLQAYLVNVLIAKDDPQLMSTSSILGRAVIDRWMMTYDPSNTDLHFDVRSADLTMPPPPIATSP